MDLFRFYRTLHVKARYKRSHTSLQILQMQVRLILIFLELSLNPDPLFVQCFKMEH